MRALTKLRYFLGEAMGNFAASPTMALASITSVTIALLLLGLFMIGEKILADTATALERKVEVTAFLADGMDESKLHEIIAALGRNDAIDSCDYVDKKKALETLKSDLGTDSDVLNYLDSNPLPASIEIKMKDPGRIAEVVEILKKFIWVEEITYGKGVVKKILAFSRILRFTGIILVILLSLAAMLTIGSTIRMTVYSRKDEIEIMQLVGATNWFVRWPFIIEGFLQGIVGSMISVILLFSGIGYLTATFQTMIALPITPDLSFRLAVKVIVIGAFLGTIGSLLAVRKVLKAGK
ncbi:MAG: hypothetical protein CVV64_00235 [Candidatus Wallbacteria bacterium HGW-Wallbacteria-1]|jgi:cell division transport system permease protein|uniref:Cell division protein FtsX n=1 Tax=Candidatus Wallbacteria bacterium HGW-Wallbacteria-1 TaxID=2013854 RepID=A0A2N1PU79_9BACT|nr:MAG: hypothetical protein CVV64_00235 [Candidatus Wallbacteria bacterium HGW-Wallbacteria-1]